MNRSIRNHPITQQLTGADVTFVGGVHHDGFRTPDGAIVIGRWEGGSIVVTGGSAPGGSASFPVGPRSVTDDVTVPLHPGIFGTFTGSSTYSLVAATQPADAFGNVGSVTGAVVNANFGQQVVTGNVSLAVNGRSFSVSGNSGLRPGDTGFTFATALSNISIGCTGTGCATRGYQGTFNGRFAGARRPLRRAGHGRFMRPGWPSS